MEKTPLQIRNELLGKKVIKGLESHHFEASYCDTKEAALAKALSLIPARSVIGYGGSATLKQIGLIEKIRALDYQLLDRDLAKSPEEKAAIQRQNFSADFFLCSANAITEDGQLLNIDGTGNRVAAMIYGPKNVIVLAGMNKVTKDLDMAMKRARTVAAPLNMMRFPNLKSPCHETGACEDCKSPDSICNYFVTLRNSSPAGRIKVILIGEELGY